jgi:hypothetical protein
MPRSHWAGLLPVDLHETLDALRFADEGDSELCNRLILALIEWIKRDRIAAVSQGVLGINLAHVHHPEVLSDYLRTALNHSIGEPDAQFTVRGDLREFCYRHPRIVVMGRLPKNRKFLQFKAVAEVNDFLKSLDMALPETKTLRIEVALRWATQSPPVDEWVVPAQFFDWIAQTYGLKEVSIPECLNSAPLHASKNVLAIFLKELEYADLIDVGWLGGVRSLKVSTGQNAAAAYDLRDALASKHRRHSKIVRPALNDGRVEISWRSEPLGFLVSEEAGQAFAGDACYEIHIPELSQVAFFKDFTLMVKSLRAGTVDSVSIKTRWGNTLRLVSFAKFQARWEKELTPTTCTAP